MNPNYNDFRFPQIKAHPWHKVCIFISFLTVGFSDDRNFSCLKIFLHILTLLNCVDLPQKDASRSYWSCIPAFAILPKSSVHCGECNWLLSRSLFLYSNSFSITLHQSIFLLNSIDQWILSVRKTSLEVWEDPYLLCSLKHVHILSLMNSEIPMLACQMVVHYLLYSTSNRK